MCLGHEQAGSYRFVRRIGTGKALTFLVICGSAMRKLGTAPLLRTVRQGVLTDRRNVSASDLWALAKKRT